MKLNTLSIIIIIFIGFSDVGSATISGVSPNATGNITIDVNTTWDNINVTLGGWVEIGNASNRVYFDIINSNITLSSYISSITNTAVNFSLINSTIFLYATTGKNATVPNIATINVSQYILFSENSNKSAPSRIELKNSTIRGTNYTTRSCGISIRSSGFDNSRAKHTLIAENMTFKWLGGLYEGGSDCYALKLRGWNSGSELENDSRLYNLTFYETGKGILLVGELELDYAYAHSGGVAFAYGKYYNHLTMNKTYEGLYEPVDNSWVRNSWFDANNTKFNFNIGNNGLFENNTVYNAAFNAGDGASTEGQNSTIKNSTFFNTGISTTGNNRNRTTIIGNTFTGGHSDHILDLHGWNLVIANNTLTDALARDGIQLQPYSNTNNIHGNSRIYNNVIRRIGNTGLYINLQTNNTYINNTIKDIPSGSAIKITNSSKQLFIDINISNTSNYDIELYGGIYYVDKSDYKFVNTNFSNNKLFLGNGAVFNNYYYLDVKTQDSNGNPLSYTIVSVNNSENINYSSININGNINVLYITEADGHTPLPIGNESTSAALLAFWKNSTTQQNMTYSLSAYDNSRLYDSTSTTIFPNGTMQQLSPLANATVSPNSSWYRRNPNTYQNTTTITITRPRTNITLNFPNGSITVNATRTRLNATTDYVQSYVVFNNTIPEFANKNIFFTVDGITYDSNLANSTGFVSFNYTGTWSTHTFEWSEATAYNITLFKGWNNISLPLKQANTSVAEVFQSIDGKYSLVRVYNASNASDHWKTYSPFAPLIASDLDNIDHTMGINIYMASNETLVVNGELQNSTNISLRQGWNLVGYPSLTNRTPASAFSSITGNYTVRRFNASVGLWRSYDSANPGASTLGSIEPGYGYWVNVSQNEVWVVE